MSSEIFFRDKMISFNEGYAAIIVCFLLEITEDLPADEWLVRARTDFEENRSRRGLGMTTIRLDDLVTSEAENTRMTTLLAQLDEKIAMFGETIPADVLNAMKPPYARFLGELPVEKLRDIVRRVRALLH